jgi:NAD(P)-dependent dehydrogenase (short-subunit alcohol dehydrogenase family)
MNVLWFFLSRKNDCLFVGVLWMALSEKLLLVTGGSRGIGAAVCRLAALEGYDVALSYRSEHAAAMAVAADIEAAGRRALVVRADTAGTADIARLFEAVDGFGPLTHLVNNAGLTGRIGPLADADPDMIRGVIDVNVTGAILVAREAMRRLRAGGAMVTISSAAATLGSPGEFVWYAASKGAIDSLTIGLSREAGPAGIRVNAISPGLIDTDIHAAAGDTGRVARLREAIPLRREGSADEVARAVLFLLSDAASYINGAIVRVAGGR